MLVLVVGRRYFTFQSSSSPSLLLSVLLSRLTVPWVRSLYHLSVGSGVVTEKGGTSKRSVVGARTFSKKVPSHVTPSGKPDWGSTSDWMIESVGTLRTDTYCAVVFTRLGGRLLWGPLDCSSQISLHKTRSVRHRVVLDGTRLRFFTMGVSRGDSWTTRLRGVVVEYLVILRKKTRVFV